MDCFASRAPHSRWRAPRSSATSSRRFLDRCSAIGGLQVAASSRNVTGPKARLNRTAPVQRQLEFADISWPQLLDDNFFDRAAARRADAARSGSSFCKITRRSATTPPRPKAAAVWTASRRASRTAAGEHRALQRPRRGVSSTDVRHGGLQVAASSRNVTGPKARLEPDASAQRQLEFADISWPQLLDDSFF
jgi:hypothetical protein